MLLLDLALCLGLPSSGRNPWQTAVSVGENVSLLKRNYVVPRIQGDSLIIPGGFKSQVPS